MSTAARYYGELKVSVATESAVSGAAAAARRFGVTTAFARYHRSKLLDASFHAGTWGGARNVKFDTADQETFDVRLFANDVTLS
jgi:hypothetical protein